MERDRQKIRSIHKKIRAEMTPQEISEKSKIICRHILDSDWYQSCSILYAYYPLENEVDCRNIIKNALSENKIVALPRTMEECRMEFYRICSLNEIQEGHFHVMEPLACCPLIQAKEAAVLVPGVAFDKQGNRIGYGKGYYDRYFSRFTDLLRIALGYENQTEDEIAVLKTDMKMNCLYTERRMYCFKTDREGFGWN